MFGFQNHDFKIERRKILNAFLAGGDVAGSCGVTTESVDEGSSSYYNEF